MSGGLTTFFIDKCEISTDAGSTWQRVPGVNSISKSGGDGSSTNIDAVEGSAQTTTAPGVATYNVTYSSLIPNHPAIIACVDAADDNDLINVRFVCDGEVLLAKDSASNPSRYIAITTGGVATITGVDMTSADYNEGLIFKVGTSNAVYTIETITNATTVDVSPHPSSPITSPSNSRTTFTIERPALTESFTARLQSAGNWDWSFGAPLSGTMVFAAETRKFFALS